MDIISTTIRRHTGTLLTFDTSNQPSNQPSIQTPPPCPSIRPSLIARRKTPPEGRNITAYTEEIRNLIQTEDGKYRYYEICGYKASEYFYLRPDKRPKA